MERYVSAQRGVVEEQVGGEGVEDEHGGRTTGCQTTQITSAQEHREAGRAVFVGTMD
jgi:hypothetical protein